MMTLRGINAADLPLNRLVNVAYALLLENRSEKDRGQFIAHLELPLGDEEITDGVWAADAELADFDKTAAALEDAFG